MAKQDKELPCLPEAGLTGPFSDTPQAFDSKAFKTAQHLKTRGTGQPLLAEMAERPRKAPLESLRLLSAWPLESQEDRNGAELEEKLAWGGRGARLASTGAGTFFLGFK